MLFKKAKTTDNFAEESSDLEHRMRPLSKVSKKLNFLNTDEELYLIKKDSRLHSSTRRKKY